MADITLSNDMDAFLATANDAAARTELGVAIGSDVQAYSAERLKLGVHGADIASATTTNLETATGQLIDVTGTTTITTITLSEGHCRIVRFTGILTLTHGASLVLPTGADITTAAGDFAIFTGYAAGVVRCLSYSRASGAALAGSGSQAVVTDGFGDWWTLTFGVATTPTAGLGSYDGFSAVTSIKLHKTAGSGADWSTLFDAGGALTIGWKIRTTDRRDESFMTSTVTGIDYTADVLTLTVANDAINDASFTNGVCYVTFVPISAPAPPASTFSGPIWTYSSGVGDPAAGEFKTDNVDPAATTALNLHIEADSSLGNSIKNLLIQSCSLATAIPGSSAILTFTNIATGEISSFSVGAPTDLTLFLNFVGSAVVGGPTLWGGDYQLSISYIVASPPVPTLTSVLGASVLTPIADGVYDISSSLGGSVTIESGIITAWTPMA